MTANTATYITGPSGLMSTSFQWSKREVESLRTDLARQHGGAWEVEFATIHGSRRWRAVQVTTREQQRRAAEVSSAQITLDPDYNWFTSARFGMKRDLAQLQTQLDEFQAGFTKNPLYALSWADKVYTAAAEYEVLSTIVRMHDDGVDPRKICAHIEDRAGRKIEHASLSHSSSPSSNIAERAQEIALCKYARLLRSQVDAAAAARGALLVL
jgi:hypothetical protein